MVMVSPLINPTACWEFEGEILVLHHPTTIGTRYQAMGNYFDELSFPNLYSANHFLTNKKNSTLW